MDEVLDVLLTDDPPFRLVVGFPNVKYFSESSRHGDGGSGFELRDTSSSDAYHETLSECDVVLLCYTPEGYRFRASGLVADAAACGAVVLVPDFPVMRHQVESPVSIGMCYSDLIKIPSLIDEMSKVLDQYKSAIPIYREGRSCAALAELLDGMIE